MKEYINFVVRGLIRVWRRIDCKCLYCGKLTFNHYEYCGPACRASDNFDGRLFK